jgi:hypothetical protein
MTKTSALNKLAQAVREYIAAEQNYMKVAQAINTVQMSKKAGIMDMFKQAPKAPDNSTRNALLGLLGGAGIAGGAGMAMQHKPGQGESVGAGFGRGIDDASAGIQGMAAPAAAKLQAAFEYLKGMAGRNHEAVAAQDAQSAGQNTDLNAMLHHLLKGNATGTPPM